MANYTAEKFPLAINMQGSNCRALQVKLGLSADGYFGANTQTALKNKTGKTTITEKELLALPYASESFPLAKGMKGDSVKALQSKLGVTADGSFWNDTEKALQSKYNTTTCSQALYNQIVNGGNGVTPTKTTDNKGTGTTPTTKKWVKPVIIVGTLAVAGILIYSLLNEEEKKSNVPTKPALSGIKRKKSKKRSKTQRLSTKPIELK